MEIAASNRVIARNGIGQFISACEAAATATVQEAIEDGAELSIELAPKGNGNDPRTVPLASSISSEMLSATSGHWIATARHALPQEFGGAPHHQKANVSFFWEEQGRRWVPSGAVGRPDQQINHPGNPAHPYLRPAYQAIMGRVMSIARKHYP